jgi:hypothetical protein
MLAGKIGYFRNSFSPASVGTLNGWWDAADAATITTVSGVVSQWNDKSTNARHLTQGTAANRPGIGTLNGRACLTFNGTTTSLTRTTGVSGLSATYFVAWKLSAVASVNRVAFATGVNSPSQAQFATGHNSAAQIVGSTRGASTIGISAGGASTNAAIVGSVVSSTAITTVRLNGVAYTTTSAGAVTGNSSGISAGCSLANGNPASFWDGSIGEILWYSGSLSSASTSAVESYLAAKWGVSL